MALVDDEVEKKAVLSPDSAVSARSSRYVEHDGPYGMERSFRIVFKDKSVITFFSDTDDEKTIWYVVHCNHRVSKA